ncbi:hypothetical protein IP78_12845 [Brevundimonas sp. AAP58]|uniref:hypothetical protein n=1 Tax=Brevundimonas sp. AAP58 TaxID=1523422 RepID=UPI0006B8BF13|nr:hypothetical protein [Brevundimonas sp. AAP58]KPF77468.1 hypothetical protein IP78_12845 [Brevundimonas sp. AAP58]
MAAAAFLSSITLAEPAQAQVTAPPQPLPADVLADEVDPAVAAFLRANVVVNGPVTGGLAIDFPPAFYESRLILLGESHGFAAPQVLDLELLAHLNERIGLTDYLAEVDPVQAEMLNAYLSSGDEAILDRVFDHWDRTGAQWGNTAFEAKVRGVRALNEDLLAERRIRFIGIDTIQDWLLLREWLADRGTPVDAAAWDDADVRGKAALASNALGEPADPMVARLADLLGRIGAGATREAAIFDTYAYAVRSGEIGNRPAYGLWGLYHVMQGPINDTLPFAARVTRSDLPTATSVTSIVILALDSAVHVPVPLPTGIQRMRLTQFNVDGPFVKVQGSDTLRAASDPDSIVVFNPGAADSPIQPGDFTRVRTSVGQNFELDPDLPSSAYSQYFGVFRGSDWAPPRD